MRASLYSALTRGYVRQVFWAAPLCIACTPLEGASDAFGGAAAESSGSRAGEGTAGATTRGGDGGGAGADGTPDAGSGGSSPNEPVCPPLAERREERLPAKPGEVVIIESDRTWACDTHVVLQGRVLVASGAKVTIEPGTVVSAEPSSLLLFEGGARIDAAGTRDLPIVFTSARPVGERSPGDWRGIVLIGRAPTHSSSDVVYDTTGDHHAQYGGGPAGDPTWSCGTMRYVRIEFAGGDVDEASMPGSALTLAGCGSETEIDYVQVHAATDGIGLVGGNAPLRHVLVTENVLGDCIEWAAGYTGSLQFVVAQSLGAGAAFAGSNSEAGADTEPVSAPTVYNATLVGSAPLAPLSHFGVLLRFGSRLVLKNSIVTGFANAGFDLRLPGAVLEEEVGLGKAIDVSHVLLFANAEDYSRSAAALSSSAAMRNDDPELVAAIRRGSPGFQPEDATVAIEPAPVPRPFDTSASFRGALPHAGRDWTLGWTDYPAH